MSCEYISSGWYLEVSKTSREGYLGMLGFGKGLAVFSFSSPTGAVYLLGVY